VYTGFVVSKPEERDHLEDPGIDGRILRLAAQVCSTTQKMSDSHLDWILLKKLECPVCFECMAPPIKMCENGHNVWNS
jgi:hypothetical protein